MSAALTTFDVFDTLLTRAVGAPASVHALLGRTEEVARITGCTPEQFAALRTIAERRAGRGGGQPTLERIYAELGAGLGLIAEERGRLLACEVHLERRLSRAVPGAPGLVERAAEGRRIAVADGPLPRALVAELLERHGLGGLFADVVAAADHGAGKRDGRLYGAVLEAEAVRAAACRHVGDDEWSDVRVPRLLGMRARAAGAARLNRYEAAWEDQAGRTAGFGSLVAGASRLARLRSDAPAERAPFVDVAAGVAAPALTAYVLWVLHSARREGIRRLHFLARDGEVLYLLARKLAPRLGFDIDLRYLYGSRSVYHRAGLADRPLEEARWAWSGMYRLTPAQVLRRLGLPEAAAQAACDRLGLRDLAIEDAVPRLVADEALREEVRVQATALRDRVQGYLRQEGMGDGVPWALVDTGWAGRIAHSLSRVLPEEAGPIRRGYLFGYMEQPDGHRAPDVLHGYLFDDYARTGHWGRAEFAYGPIETFTVADHGMTLDFAHRDGRWEPVLASARNPALAGWPWALIRRTVADFADALVLDPDIAAAGADLRAGVAEVLSAFWLDPTAAEARCWGAYPFEDDILATSRHPVARPILVQDFLGKARGSYEGRRQWLAASVRLSAAALQPPARAGLWLNDRRRAGGATAFLPERWHDAARLLGRAARTRRS